MKVEEDTEEDMRHMERRMQKVLFMKKMLTPNIDEAL